MNTHAERSRSLWMETTVPDAQSLDGDRKVDVVVVGSGIAGLSVAYELSRLGEEVAVLDRGPLAGGMTSRTSAHLTSSIDDLYQELIRLRGEKEARGYLRSRLAAIDRIEAIQGKKGSIAISSAWTAICSPRKRTMSRRSKPNSLHAERSDLSESNGSTRSPFPMLALAVR